MPVEAIGADLRAFAAVDEAEDPLPLIRALDEGKAYPGMRTAEEAIAAALRLEGATAVLDVGCGLGADAIAMAGRVPQGARVTGLDLSRTMVAEARLRAARAGAAVSFEVGSALELPFSDGEFDRCRAQTLLQHVPDAPRAIAEIARVLRPGGRAVAFEFDLGTTVLDHPDRATTRTILDYVTDAALQGWIGRQLPRLYREAGFTEVTVHPHPVPNDFAFFLFTMRRPLAQLVKDRVLTARQVIAWKDRLEQLHEDGHYLGGTTGYLVSATKA
ncbi:methyltransferase domain-containing protein [Kitasatospora sp. CM 4170]|uniref:Methyltransferase domain-containing protein n=1 Tax=Kitasatospora aburaviensis TaxID=67265 RepID=A0ABW1ETN9_9ACTN|nr:methyltransferase domain-containing protein [Kitasatospora sp. CM 4170]WNM44685.1 methyltransferase domain-containing protein [Kitasatospora sp. CM 4170]